MPSNSLPLNDDIIDRVFTFCPDFETLRALKSTCQALRAIHTAHPNSINPAVARNLTDIFPDALRALRQEVYITPKEGTPDGGDDISPAAAEPEDTSPVTMDELPQLRKNDVVVHRLEVLFSIWYKNRRSPVSVLSAEETFRFHRAMYRSLSTPLRLKMLDAYPTADLRQIYSVVQFLRAMLHGVFKQPELDGTYDVCLAAGPALILATYESRDPNTMSDACPVVDYVYDGGAPYLGFFYGPLSEIWSSREVSNPPEDSAHLRSILDTANDATNPQMDCYGHPQHGNTTIRTCPSFSQADCHSTAKRQKPCTNSSGPTLKRSPTAASLSAGSTATLAY
ncbi:hypothetical protein B0H16DRAFT_1723114 [Mycena metata]|uniref:F-box domain-containing protein n=1 Tax=Mycena metata TaxID=1033252 RepID=A0AAD7IYX5_9AGAR|nr:hypothetical protein B0H16DRAFT_1723114 [Mycena metata]